jgi:hypothetical protein
MEYARTLSWVTNLHGCRDAGCSFCRVTVESVRSILIRNDDTHFLKTLPDAVLVTTHSSVLQLHANGQTELFEQAVRGDANAPKIKTKYCRVFEHSS